MSKTEIVWPHPMAVCAMWIEAWTAWGSTAMRWLPGPGSRLAADKVVPAPLLADAQANPVPVIRPDSIVLPAEAEALCTEAAADTFFVEVEAAGSSLATNGHVHLDASAEERQDGQFAEDADDVLEDFDGDDTAFVPQGRTRVLASADGLGSEVMFGDLPADERRGGLCRAGHRWIRGNGRHYAPCCCRSWRRGTRCGPRNGRRAGIGNG